MLCHRGYLVLILSFMLSVLCGNSCELQPLFKLKESNKEYVNTKQEYQVELKLQEDGKLEINEVDDYKMLPLKVNTVLTSFSAKLSDSPKFDKSEDKNIDAKSLNNVLSDLFKRAKRVHASVIKDPSEEFPIDIGRFEIKKGGKVSMNYDSGFENLDNE